MAQRLPKRDDLVNVLEVEEAARSALPPAVFASIGGSHRAGFDRITFRPRMMVPTLDLDLSVALFGATHFSPLIVGPIADQRRYHPDGELATARGASAARAKMVVSGRSSVPLPQIAGHVDTPLWFSVYADPMIADARRQIDEAQAMGCTVMCIAAGPARALDWRRIEGIIRGVTAPVVIKGVMTPHDATTAIGVGAKGVIVSDHGAAESAGPTPIDALPRVVESCAGKIEVLVDGSFRRGSDVAKALALGARGVLIGRPIMWGLAAYGADGVQHVIAMLQNELGRTLGALGASNRKRLTPEMVRIHGR
jgi:4-hydroxymandelate oxidase